VRGRGGKEELVVDLDIRGKRVSCSFLLTYQMGQDEEGVLTDREETIVRRKKRRKEAGLTSLPVRGGGGERGEDHP